MVAVHTEEAFEAAIEVHLLARGYLKGDRHDFDLTLALDRAQALAFVQDSQPREWAKLAAVHGAQVESRFLGRLARELDARGTLDVLRHGITDYGVTFKLAYFKPAHAMAPELGALYEKNRLSVTRQVRYSATYAYELDGIFVNGLPVATAELKDQLTGQTVQDAIRQYREDRDPRGPAAQLQAPRPRPLRRGSRRGLHDHPAGRHRYRLPAVQPGALHRAIDLAVTRYGALDDDDAREEFRTRLVAFTRLYAFLSQILTFQDPGLEMLYAYGRFLLLKLPHKEQGSVDLGLDVRLEYYRLSRTAEQQLTLGEESVGLKAPKDTGTAGEHEVVLAPLSTIIAALNERFGTEFTFADKLLFDQIEEVLVADDTLAQQAKANSLENYQFGFEAAFMEAVIDRKATNEGIFMRILDDKRFAEAVRAFLMEKVYQRQQSATAV